jgi:hypothetical protein
MLQFPGKIVLTLFAVAKVKDGDTLSSLASQYLNDAAKGWMTFL